MSGYCDSVENRNQGSGADFYFEIQPACFECGVCIEKLGFRC